MNTLDICLILIAIFLSKLEELHKNYNDNKVVIQAIQLIIVIIFGAMFSSNIDIMFLLFILQLVYYLIVKERKNLYYVLSIIIVATLGYYFKSDYNAFINSIKNKNLYYSAILVIGFLYLEDFFFNKEESVTKSIFRLFVCIALFLFLKSPFSTTVFPPYLRYCLLLVIGYYIITSVELLKETFDFIKKQNLREVLIGNMERVYNLVMTPINIIFKLFSIIISQISQTIQHFRNHLIISSLAFKAFVGNAENSLEDKQNKARIQYEKMRDLLKKQNANYKNLQHYADGLNKTLVDMASGDAACAADIINKEGDDALREANKQWYDTKVGKLLSYTPFGFIAK